MALVSLISDSPVTSALLREALERVGHKATLAHWSEPELARVLRARPNLVIAEFASLSPPAAPAFRRAIGRLGSQCNVLALFSPPDNSANLSAVVDMAEALIHEQEGPRVVESRWDYGFLTVDVHRREALIGDKRIPLTPTEAHLLCVLGENAGRCVAAEELIAQVQGYEADPHEARDIIRVHICNLRRKLQNALGAPPLIVSVRGEGYMLQRRTAPAPTSEAAYAGRS